MSRKRNTKKEMFQPMTTVYKTRLSYRFIIICMHGPKKWGPLGQGWLGSLKYLCGAICAFGPQKQPFSLIF